MKTCTKCHIEKDESEFYKRGTGLRADCKACSNKRVADWLEKNKEKRKDIVRKWDKKNRKSKNVYRKAWRKRNPIKSRVESFKRSKRNRAELSDRYIRDIFRKLYGERFKNKDLIEIKRLLIKIKRSWQRNKEN